MVKTDSFLFNRTILSTIAVLILVCIGIVLSSCTSHYSSDTAAVIEFQGETLSVNQSTLTQMEAIAAQQNLTLNQSFVIERLTQIEVLKAQARHLGIAPTKDEIDSAVAAQLTTLDSQGLAQALVAQNMTRDAFTASLRNSISQDLLFQELFQKEVVEKVQVSDDQLQQIYKANPGQFVVPESVSVKHILICYVGATSCTGNMTKDQAKQSIDAIYLALQNNQSFEQLAAQFSTDTGSAAHGGDLGKIIKGQTVKEFEAVAFATPVGSISQPFESQFGYHVLAVYAKNSAQQLSFDQVKDQLKSQVIQQQANAMQQAYINGLMASAKVTVLAK